MRYVLAPLFFIGRIALWVFVLPVGIWRSLVHHRKKAQRRALKQMRQEIEAQKP